ncbi:MAG: ribose 5-phosphate isomerase B [Deltaproteobacteria bacterium]|nr:ribose 5-phosphate isomerase B [Deltaproteobacteria bacterium]
MHERRIALGCDHAGLALKFELLGALDKWGWAVEDLGCHPLAADGAHGLRFDQSKGVLAATDSVDYPDFALAVAQSVADGRVPLGLLICGSGIGMSIAANKVAGVRAALCHDPYSAHMCRAHNDANVLCLGGRVIGPEVGRAVLREFLETTFEGGRHQRRLDKIRQAERSRR